MGQVKNVMNDMGRAAVNPEKGKLGVRTQVEVKMAAQIRESLFRFQESLGYFLDQHLTFAFKVGGEGGRSCTANNTSVQKPDSVSDSVRP